MAHGLTLSRRHFLLGSLAAGAAVAPIGWYGAFYERDDIEVVQRSVTIRNLPASVDGLKAVQISDLHVSEITDVHRRMLDTIQGLRPDLMLVTGDLVDVDTAVDDVADLLGSIQVPRGTWAVPGNRDHLAEAVYPLSQALPSHNAHLLVNRSVQLDDGFWVVGVDDPSEGYDDLSAALYRAPASSVRILLTHAPNVVERLRGARFDLILAGHTHGGQIDLPLVRDNWLRDDMARRYPAGGYRVGDSSLYVNRGIGTYYLPIRIGARPEITIFTFHAA